ncbi:MAG: hypothetical protein A2667_01535 [Candidatus Wildermuthbacteria bacterium RIFCSPHIGHO2_01_FULL_47_27]|uniref:DUF5666 domain-containing protein n=1 Tax=Candidatus Wildermuthbacteria bacterium RIFCSPHIGHO2_02_FULL_47_17 TaxID=1802452 RepID=A0A1G2R4K3_9BACT|nr:MAG: hypothetical protein UY15_C0001G0005 [Parcubacteria group bacterium GW2011_GWA2_47_9]OHA63194.1 MAG: hypothetical protein A2667_01535 [Candidatus Wildermuthbacteria bacterium RIFCSPHIGHO2_01_FULL_47_27]OHA67790.1 MAG: hypothetical protein A3D59_03015 [Candidatus Wildermuthbacteria bacterium RIFCSPHIGHO2_02_FULL_47_17]
MDNVQSKNLVFAATALILGLAVGFGVNQVIWQNKLAKTKQDVETRLAQLPSSPEALGNPMLANWQADAEGQIAEVSENEIVVKNDAGQTLRAAITSQTVIIKVNRRVDEEGAVLSFADLKIGQAVGLVVNLVDGKLVARAITAVLK